MHPANAFYGHRRILCDYAGIDAVAPIWGHVQHGWVGAWTITPPGRLAPWLPLFLWNEEAVATCRQLGIRHVTAVGAPFLYLIENLAGILPEGWAGSGGRKAGERTLFYPFHTTDRVGVAGSHRTLAAQVRDWFPGDTTVCLYWTDFRDPGVRASYEAVGLPIICHGRRHQVSFLSNQLAALLRVDRVATNRVGTALWYGALLGREVAVVGESFLVDEGHDERRWAAERARWPELYSGSLRGDDARALARQELGAEFRRSPAEMAELLGLHRQRALGRAGAAVVRAEHRLRTGFWYGTRLRTPSDVATVVDKIRRKRRAR